jgi:hypothetical protein
MLSFERKYKKEREEESKNVIYFVYHKEGRIIQFWFNLFSHLKNKQGEERKDRKLRHKSDGYKNKKKAKAMQAMWRVESDNIDTDGSGTESGED